MKSDGGPAFPHPELASTGMSLRDYFAAKAMQAEMITSFSDATPEAAQDFVDAMNKAGYTVEQHLAINAYSIADAMLAERAKAKL